MNGFAVGNSLRSGFAIVPRWGRRIVPLLALCAVSSPVHSKEEAYGVYAGVEGAPVTPDLPPVVAPEDVEPSPSDAHDGIPEAETASSVLAPVTGPTPETVAEYTEFSPLLGTPDAASAASTSCCTHTTLSCECPGWLAGVDYLNWKLRRRGLDYAVAEDGTATTLGSGRIQNLEFSRDSGVRASLGYQFDTLWQLRFGYTWFDADDVASSVRPPGTGQLFATRSHPVNNEEADTASAFGSFDLQVFDLEAARWMRLDNVSSLRVFAGLRFADIEENLIFDYDGRDFTNGRITNPVNLNGFGIRSGLEGRWDMFERLSLFGRAAVSVMFANITSRLTETDFAGAVVIADEVDEYDQALPVLEAMLGAAYHFDRFEVSGGYELSNWFNLGERATFNDDANEGNYGPFSTDLLLEGFVLQLTMRR